ncbi:MAG: hypothetical protein U9Q39_01695, partial [Pseudomonadota bacterium]|nr:hypothetical protein [Pseudomonadota bacterium]
NLTFRDIYAILCGLCGCFKVLRCFRWPDSTKLRIPMKPCQNNFNLTPKPDHLTTLTANQRYLVTPKKAIELQLG